MTTTENTLAWLRETDAARLNELWSLADRTRRAHVGDVVHLRGLVEISNHCARSCAYCGLRAPNARVTRYRMSQEEILSCARTARELGFGTVVLQAGEDPGLTRDGIAGLVRAIKRETGLAVTLSLGERSEDELACWHEAGADRYLLRFETSDRALFERIHPPLSERISDRIALLRKIREIGYEAGGGVMIGIPGQGFASLARDIELFRELDLDMIGVGPFIPHPDTPLANAAPDDDQVPNTEEMTYKVIALTRLARPDANIPSTTALATINRESGRELGLQRGANVVMPNLTPQRYRLNYAIYPDKAGGTELPLDNAAALRSRILALGRTVGVGPGGRCRQKHAVPLHTRDSMKYDPSS